MSKVLFKEKQNIKPRWVWILFTFLLLIFIYTIVMQVFLGKPVGNEPASASVMWLNGGLLLLVFLLIKNMVLLIEVRDDALYYKYSPIYRKWRKIDYDNIKKVYIRKYNAISEYGGYGIRFGISGKGRALNVRGNMGLQLEFKDDKSNLLLGTQKPKKLAKALSSKIDLYEPKGDESKDEDKIDKNKDKSKDENQDNNRK